mgnify:CR=1 FL=1|jgi:hypothetical protein|tara:strand:+ start:243 stop:467 length:225 start_codon:yes stop_codon:yes gene_type:complete
MLKVYVLIVMLAPAGIDSNQGGAIGFTQEFVGITNCRTAKKSLLQADYTGRLFVDCLPKGTKLKRRKKNATVPK